MTALWVSAKRPIAPGASSRIMIWVTAPPGPCELHIESLNSDCLIQLVYDIHPAPCTLHGLLTNMSDVMVAPIHTGAHMITMLLNGSDTCCPARQPYTVHSINVTVTTIAYGSRGD